MKNSAPRAIVVIVTAPCRHLKWCCLPPLPLCWPNYRQ